MANRLAIQGERGSFAQEAGFDFFGQNTTFVFCPSLTDLFAAIENCKAEYAVLPIENSIGGAVEQNKRFLQFVSWQTIDSLYLPIRQSLVACLDSEIETLKTVESHPAALAQCRKFFQTRQNLRQIASENTAASAKAVIESGDAARAAIAHRRTAEIYGGKVLMEDIQDEKKNYTKFLILKR